MSAVDAAYRMIRAAQYMAEYREQITAWRAECLSCKTIAGRLGVNKTTVAYACAEWGVKPPHPLHKGREPMVDGPRCAECGILLSEVPGSKDGLCGYCLAPHEIWPEMVCNVESAAVTAYGMGRMEL